MTMDPANRAALAAILDPAIADDIDRIPLAMACELLADDQGFITRYQVTPKLVRRFTPEMRHMCSPDALRAILPVTRFSRTRMQPLAGAMGAVASSKWPRYSYFPYVPLGFMLDPAPEATLIVAVHGSSRSAQAQRNGFVEFAERHGMFVMAPLFPIDLDADVPDEEYKYLAGSRDRFDLILLDMIDEYAAAFGVSFPRILLCGFSGGGQFAHRFLYIHPERLTAVSIGAPGFVTLPDDSRDWWVGTRDVEARFGKAIDVDAMRRVPVQLLCGAADDIPFEIYSAQEMAMSEDDYARYGRNRVERVETLRAALTGLGLDVTREYIDGVPHAFGPAMAGAMQRFFAKHLGLFDAG